MTPCAAAVTAAGPGHLGAPGPAAQPGAQSAGRSVTGRQDVTERIPARPTTYKGIRMRSRLEADYAAMLDHKGIEWEYEPECFACPEGQYLPDFRIKSDPHNHWIELKPAGRLREHFNSGEIDKILARMTIIWASKPGDLLLLAYWEQGGPMAFGIYSGKMGQPWACTGPGIPFPLLWPGMGQLEAAAEAVQDDGMARALAELATHARNS